MSEIKKHILHYLILALVLSIAFWFFAIFNYNRLIQIQIIIFSAFLYVLWGISHHFFDKDLNLKIVFEYLVFGIFWAATIIFLLARS